MSEVLAALASRDLPAAADVAAVAAGTPAVRTRLGAQPGDQRVILSLTNPCVGSEESDHRFEGAVCEIRRRYA